ncbi:MAG TPA: glycosyltransferase [Patescibacteria group bacterium]
MKTSVIITVLNEAQTMEALLMALSKQTKVPDEVVIVDGGSMDKTFDILKAASKKRQPFSLKVFQKKGNRSLGRNYAIEQATHEWIAITDAGCIPERQWLEELGAKAEGAKKEVKSDQVVIAGYYQAEPKSSFEAAVVPYFLVMPERVNPDDFLPATRSMMLHRSVWQAVGKFNTSLSDNEDYAFANKIRDLETKRHQKIIFFTDKAKVTWLPPTTLHQFAKTIFRFARGDAQSGNWRPKVGLIFGRYLVLLIATGWLVANELNGVAIVMWLFFLSVYAAWSIAKNIRYSDEGWYWLPVLQIVSDGAVMSGTLVGICK